MPDKRRPEATEELIRLVASMDEEDAVQAVYELRSKRRYIKGTKGRELKVPTLLQTIDSLAQFQVTGLLDSGCTGSCINRKFVENNGIETTKLKVPLPVYNADGSINAAGSITDFVEMRMTLRDHTERITLAVTDLGNTDLFIGHDWLKLPNPSIDWQTGTIVFDRCPDACGYNLDFLDIDADPDPDMEPELALEEDDRLFMIDWQGYISSGTHDHHACRGITRNSDTPDYITEFPEVFSQEEFDQLPERRPWDHAIELTPGLKPPPCKVYPLNASEQKALDEFLEENLRSGRIRSSKSPMASPFFFVKKKHGKLRPVQDYRKLNDMTV